MSTRFARLAAALVVALGAVSGLPGGGAPVAAGDAINCPPPVKDPKPGGC